MNSQHPDPHTARGQGDNSLPNTNAAPLAAPQHPVPNLNRVPQAGNPDVNQMYARYAQGFAAGASTQQRPSIDAHNNHPYNNSSPSGNFAQSPVVYAPHVNGTVSMQPHGADHQRPGQTVNFFRGAQVTFSGGLFETVQSSQVLKVQDAAQPPDDEGLPSAAAHYDETYNEFMGDDLTDDYFRNTFVYNPIAQNDYLDSSFMKPKDASKEQQLSDINDHINNNNNGDNDFIAFAQYDLGGVVTPSGPVNIKSEINHYDQSVGGADVHDERAEVEQSRANVSLDKKRSRATGDDGDGSEVSGRIGNDRIVARPSTVQPKTIKTSKRAKSDTPIESIEDPATMQADTVQSPARTHVSKVLASERPPRPSRRQSLAAADYTDVKVADGGVKGMTFAEAQEMFTRRRALEIDGSDDVNEVKAEPEKWILAIMQAFDQPYSETPNTPTFNKDLIPEFQRWQKEHYAATMEHLEDNKDKDLVEACATMLYHLVVEAHEKGAIVESAGKSFAHDITSTCKERLEKIIEVLTALSIVRKDIVTGFRMNELIASPSFVMKRKEENKQENDKKKEHKKARSEEAKAKLEEKTKAAKLKRDNMGNGKGKRKAEDALTDSDGESNNGNGEKGKTANKIAKVGGVFSGLPMPSTHNGSVARSSSTPINAELSDNGVNGEEVDGE